LQRFLADHHVPYSLPLYDDSGRYLFAAPQKVEVLARGLLRAVGRGRDNELFVILADLLELSDELEPLLQTIKVALARHHQVMVICPWPAGVPWRGREEEPERFEDGGSKMEDRGSRIEDRASESESGGRGRPGGSRSSILDPRSSARRRRLTGSRPSAFLQRLTADRFHQAFRRLQRTFARLGVPVICARDSEPARLIIERMNRLRPLGMKR